MMSQTHILIASALFAKPGETLRNLSVIAGSFVPDAAIYGLFVWSKIKGIPENRVWDEIYWQEPWRAYTAAGNSVFIYLALLIIGFLALRSRSLFFQLGMVLTFSALAALTHLAGDFPVHVKDAHQHLWPFSDWTFISEVSYWDPAHHGRTFMVFEALLGMVLCIILARRFKNWPIRVLLVTFFTAYIAVPLYFIAQIGV